MVNRAVKFLAVVLFLLSFHDIGYASNLDSFGFFWSEQKQTVKPNKAIKFELESNVVGLTHSTSSNAGQINLPEQGNYEILFEWRSATPGAKVALFLNGSQQVEASMNSTGFLTTVMLASAGGDVLSLKNISGQNFVLQSVGGVPSAKLTVKKIGENSPS